MKTYICKVFGDRVNVFEAEVNEQPKWYDIRRNGVDGRIYKDDRHHIIGSLSEISEKLETMVQKRKKALEELLSIAERDIGICRNIKEGMTCIVTRPVREDFGEGK